MVTLSPEQIAYQALRGSPSGLVAAAGSQGVSLKWKVTGLPGVAYSIYRGTAAGRESISGKTYFCKVKAVKRRSKDAQKTKMTAKKEPRKAAMIHLFKRYRTHMALSASLILGTAFPAAAQQWQAVPMVTQKALNAGNPGGEGGQVIRSLAISPSDPNFLLMGTDVGGIYRSLDGGRHWQVCMVGWNARGGNAFAVDPKNANRVLGVGANGGDFGPPAMGLYLSTDKGASWKQVVPRNDGNEFRSESLAWDPASYDATVGYCLVAYYDSRDGGLFKTTDGGLTWQVINKDMSKCVIKVHPTKGYVYAASNSNPDYGTPCGFYKSADGGLTFRRISKDYTLGMDVITTRPDSVYLAGWSRVTVSTDAGETFHPVGANTGLPWGKPIRDIKVSPANPQFMACNHGGDQWWQFYSFFSHDGGETWQKPTWDTANAFLPFNQPAENCAFSSTDPNIVLSPSSGWINKSIDGGATYHYASNGENAIMIGSSFSFSSTSPKTIYLSFQDYNGAVTTNGGRSWAYVNPAGNDWGGYEYGGHAVNANIMWTGDAPSWGGPRTLKVSRDGGKTWDVAKDAAGKPAVFQGADVSSSDPVDSRIGFAANWRTTDQGLTWKAMEGCEGVFTYNPIGAHELYGRHGNDIVQSEDRGATWTKVTTVAAGGIADIAYDQVKRRFWIASGDVLKKYENGILVTVDTPKDQYGAVRVSSVAVDPANPTRVYAASHKDLYACNNAVVFSHDGGATWTNLTVTHPLSSPSQPGGPHEVQWVRVNPATHELWAGGQCYGMWKLTASDATQKAGPKRQRSVKPVVKSRSNPK